MEEQENHQEDVKTLIPINKLQKFKRFFGVTLNQQHKYVQLYQNRSNSKQKNALSVYSAQSIIKIFRIANQNSNYFLSLYALNTTLSKYNKKQFVVNRLLRQRGQISFYQICEQLKSIRRQTRDKAIFQEYLRFVALFLQKVKHVIYKFCDSLVVAISDCISFYLKKSKNVKSQKLSMTESEQNSYEVVVGFNKLCISFYSSTEYSQNIMNQHKNYLRQVCAMCDYDFKSSQINLNQLQVSEHNIIQNHQIPSKLYKKLTEQKRINQKQNLPQNFYTCLIIQIFVKYAEDIYFFVQSSIVFLTNLVFQKKQLKNLNFNQQFIDMEEFRQKKAKQTFMNLYCQHFQGIPIQSYKNGQSCPICGQLVLVDQLKSFQRNKNVFQYLLSKNYLNPNQDNILYYFKNKIFCLANKNKFANYAHFCQFIKTENHIRDRPEITLLLEYQSVVLYNKLWGKKKLFLKEQLISTPVRGKYCRHIQFFQLMRVYEKYLNREQDQTEFECFLCMEPIEYSDIMYLHEIKLLIDIVKLNFYDGVQISLNSWIQIDHRSESVHIGSQLDKGYMKKTFALNIYNTIIDPLTKSEKNIVKGKIQDKSKQQDQEASLCLFTNQFERFFYGY